MATFAPSLMCMDYGKMKEQFEIMDKYVDIYHVDIMDGHFCKNMALRPALLKGCTSLTDKEMDVHLMTTDPADWIEMCANAGTTYISPHAETINTSAFRTMKLIQSYGCKCGVVLNPATPIGFGFAYFVAKALHKNIYEREQIENLKSAVPMGVLNIVEGVIPIVMGDFLRAIIASAIGGACGGAVTMILGADSKVPFGGFLMLPTMTRPWTGLVSIIVNVLVTGLVYAIIAKNKEENAEEEEVEEELNLDDIEIF